MKKALAQTIALGAGAVLAVAIIISGGTSATAQEGRRGGGPGPAAEPAHAPPGHRPPLGQHDVLGVTSGGGVGGCGDP